MTMSSVPFFRTYFLLISTIFLTIPMIQGWAEPSTKEKSYIQLSVRAIQATNPISDADSNSTTKQTVVLDSDLRDLEQKLSQLPFGNFQLLSSKQEVITLKSKNSIRLPNGQSLAFRPMYLDAKRVGLWLHWRDGDGSEILNTRVHFDAAESVLTGTDCAHNEGLVLAIKASAIAE